MYGTVVHVKSSQTFTRVVQSPGRALPKGLPSSGFGPGERDGRDRQNGRRGVRHSHGRLRERREGHERHNPLSHGRIHQTHHRLHQVSRLSRSGKQVKEAAAWVAVAMLRALFMDVVSRGPGMDSSPTI